MARIKKDYRIKGLDDLVKTVAVKVKTAREEAGISQNELSKRSSVAQSTINEIENQQASDLQFSTVCQLANGLGLPIRRLLSTTDLEFADQDQKEFSKSVDDLEKCFKSIQRLRQRVVK